MFKAAILSKIKKIEIQNFIIPKKLRDDQVLVKIKYSGICGSQIMEYLGNRGKDNYLPHAFGHEAAGHVVAIGKKVKKVSPKDEVILSWIKGKGLDYGGFELTNINNQKINFGPISTFSSFAIVSENRVFLKPKKMSKIEAVLYGCATPTGAGIVINQLKKIKKKHKVCLIGVGGVGMAALLALIKKKPKIFVIEKNKKKKQFLKKFNINLINDKEIKSYKNFFDFCIETSGSTKMIEGGFDLIKNDGKLIFASHPKNSKKIKLNPHDLISGKKIYGSWGGNCKLDSDIDKIFEYFDKKNIFSSTGKISFFNLKNINKAFNKVISGEINRAVIKF
ncbi:alcohol dehydrogenase catalytic domain-containing protein [Candidatus Pelagibacter ubique]|nr:alcohol dehydrogenase catalytic domain-containing protein [Candidatus Pelagibacter ubique]